MIQAPDPGAVGLPRRLAAMFYDATLLAGISFAVSFALLAGLGWRYPLSGGQRWILQAVLFSALTGYFVYFWTQRGQTLAMKSWRLRVTAATGGPVPLRAALLRYLLAWGWIAPGFAAAALLKTGIAASLALVAGGALAMTLPALTRADRQLPHDLLSQTRLVRAG